MSDFDSELFDDDDFRQRPKDAAAEKHLRSPITISLLTRMLELHKKLVTQWDETYITENPSIRIKSLKIKDPGSFFSNLESLAIPLFEHLRMTAAPPKIVYPESYPERLSRTLSSSGDLEVSLRESQQLYEVEMRAFSRWATIPEVSAIAEEEINRKFVARKETFFHHEVYRYWDFLVERYRYTKKNRLYGQRPCKIRDSTFRFFDGFVLEQIGEPVVEKNSDGKIIARQPPPRFLYSFEQLQMFQDAALARMNALLALDAGMHNGSSRTKDLLLRLLSWQEEVLSRYNNAGYELVKGPESVTKAFLTEMTKGDVLPISSLVRTIAKLKTKEEKLSGDGTSVLVDKLADIISECKDLSTVAELFGCTKLSGHPFVYAEKSASSVREEACPEGKVDYLAVRRTHWHFKRLVLDRYLEKHRSWPPFEKKFRPRRGTKLRKYWRKGLTRVPSQSYPLEDWEDVEFGKFMEFDYSPDYLDMIDDKAINPGGSKAANFWFPVPNGGERRLLTALIKTPDIDTKEIVEKYRRGMFSLDDRYVELTQKEREFKTSARCFCKLTLSVRIFFILTEANLKRFMGGDTGENGYLPQQTMTMSNTTLRRRLYDLTANENKPNTCLVEVDYSRWNLRWRASTVNPIARTLEKIFGLPGVFSQAHYFFSSSTVVITDKHTLPPGVKKGMPAHRWPESPLVWRNHLGGFEGIQQTLWTICTIAMMYFSLEEELCTFKMAGQGDNQVFYVSFDITNRSRQFSLMLLLDALERRSALLNHEVKPEECIDSSTVLTYGKEIYVNGVHVLYSLKFSSRAFARLDHSAPSLTKDIAGVVANSIAVAGTLKETILAVWWKHVQTLLLLRRRLSSPVYADEHGGIRRLLAGRNSRETLLIPGSLGGLPMMPWTRYFSKGETDDLSFDVAATYWMSNESKVIKGYMALLLKGEFSSKSPDVTNLINDPHSVPIERPDDATHLIADAVGKRLPGLVRNKDLLPLVSTSLRDRGEKYKAILSKMKPLHPDIAADLFALTPAGLYQKTVKRFSMTRTINKLVPGLDFEAQITQASARLLGTLINRVVSACKSNPGAHPPPFKAAGILREMWKIDLKNSSIGVYTPFDFKLGYFTNKFPTVSAHVRPSSNLLETKGGFPPNFGTSTQTKVSDHGYRIVNCNSTMRDLKSALLIYSELQGDQSIRPLISSIVEARSPWKLDQLVPIFPTVYGGTAVHRHAASRHHFAVLGSCSVPTHIHFSSDNAGILSGGEVDYPVVFQTLYLTLTNLYQNMAAKDLLMPSSLAYFIPESLEVIDSAVSTYTDPIKKIEWPNLADNKLAYVKDIFATEVPVVPDPRIIPHVTPATIDDADMLYSYIESRISPTVATSGMWDGILSPKDVFDFKEISRINPDTVETVLKWSIITEVVFQIASSREEGQTIGKLGSLMRKVSLIYAGMWVRIRLHPMFLDSDYNRRRLLQMYPGEFGYRRPVECLASILRSAARRTLLSQDVDRLPRLVLFNDWKSTTKPLMRRRSILAHSVSMYPACDFDKINSIVSKFSPPSQLLDRDPAAYVQSATRRLSRHIRGTEYILPEMECSYINISAEEMLRTMRDRPIYSRVETVRSNVTASIRRHGILKYEISNISGSLPAPVLASSTEISEECRMRVLSRRIRGRTTPLYSDWNAVLDILPKDVCSINREVHLFGIGRGATARCYAERGIKTIGYDLANIFPALAQRSSSFVPPELLMVPTGSALFRWSDHTLLTDGDVLAGRLDIEDAPTPLAVIDIDSGLSSIVSLLGRLPLRASVVLRFKGREEEVKYLLDLLRPDRTVVLAVDTLQPRDVVMYVKELQPVGAANYERAIITKFSELEYVYSDHELSYQFFDVCPKYAREALFEPDTPVEEIKSELMSLRRKRKSDMSATEREMHNILTFAKSDGVAYGACLRIRALCMNICDM